MTEKSSSPIATLHQHDEAWEKIHDLLAAGHWTRARAIFDQAVSSTPSATQLEVARENGYAAGRASTLTVPMSATASAEPAALSLAHDMAKILQIACDADEAPAKELLHQIAEIASKHPWPATPRPSALQLDPGTEKLLRTLLDRAYKMLLQAGYRVMEHAPNHNDPIIAWMSDARHVLYGSGRQPDLARLT